MNLKLIIEAFRTNSKQNPLGNYQKRKKITARSLVKRFATGNINLQLGRFSTEGDIDERRKKVSEYFC